MKRSMLVIVLCFAGALLVSCSSDKTTGSASSTTATDRGGSSPAASPIPDSTAIDKLTKDLTNMKAADLVAKCNVLATVVLSNENGMNNDSDVKDSLTALTNVVRPLDPAVADALAGDAKAAAAWCKAKGMTNI